MFVGSRLSRLARAIISHRPFPSFASRVYTRGVELGLEEFGMSEQQSHIESTSQENRHFPPPPAFSAGAYQEPGGLRSDVSRIDREPRKVLGDVAGELHWFKKWEKVLDWNVPDAKWFIGGKTNLSFNCLDRQIAAGRGDKVAILWEGEPLQTSASSVEPRAAAPVRSERSPTSNSTKKSANSPTASKRSASSAAIA